MRIPILRLGNVLLTSLPNDITDQLAMDLQSDALEAIREGRAGGIVIDISAADVVDSYMARVLTETARMVEIMGGVAVLVGMSPPIAMTLIDMGTDVIKIETARDLDAGVAVVKARLSNRRGGHAPVPF